MDHFSFKWYTSIYYFEVNFGNVLGYKPVLYVGAFEVYVSHDYDFALNLLYEGKYQDIFPWFAQSKKRKNETIKSLCIIQDNTHWDQSLFEMEF